MSTEAVEKINILDEEEFGFGKTRNVTPTPDIEIVSKPSGGPVEPRSQATPTQPRTQDSSALKTPPSDEEDDVPFDYPKETTEESRAETWGADPVKYASFKQIGMLRAILDKKGYKDPNESISSICKALGHPIASTKEVPGERAIFDKILAAVNEAADRKGAAQ